VNLTCSRTRRLLWPDGALRAVTPDLELAEQHLAGCDGCRRFLDDMRQLARLIHEHAPRPVAPREVRERLFRAIARVRSGSTAAQHRWTRIRWGGLAAGIAAALALALWHQRGPVDQGAVVAYAEDHVRAIRGEGIVADDRAAVSQWLADRLSFIMDVPDLPELRLKGARLCIMDGRRGGVVEFETQGHFISYYVVPDPHPPTETGPAKFRKASHDGYRIVAWHEPGLVHVLVGDLPEASLIDLAQRWMSQTVTVLSRSTEIRG